MTVDLSDDKRSLRRRLRREWSDLRMLSVPGARQRLLEYLMGAGDRDRLHEARDGRDTCTPSSAHPLVSVRIATRHRPQLLVERAIASALNQTYNNLEIVVVSDGPDSKTREAVAALADARVRYVELGRPTRYPSLPRHRWLVAGYEPMNVAITLCRGEWIAPCDDDDELLPHHVELLLTHARRHDLEFVYGKTEVVISDEEVALLGHSRLRQGNITHGSILYAAPLSFFRYSGDSYLLGEPFDWNLWKRMRRAGVRIGFVDEVVYRYFPADQTRELYAQRVRDRRRSQRANGKR